MFRSGTTQNTVRVLMNSHLLNSVLHMLGLFLIILATTLTQKNVDIFIRNSLYDLKIISISNYYFI